MATCYDCIHCEACSDAGDAGYSSLKEDVSKCKHFKNKADFVEIPCRCEKCQYSIKHTCSITGIETLFCDYGEKPFAVEPAHYCGYGIRKE